MSNRPVGFIYLVHFDRPYKHARHYLGFSENLDARLKAHHNGAGARLLRVVREAGINFKLSQVWIGTKSLERKLKNRKKSSDFCTICRKERK